MGNSSSPKADPNIGIAALKTAETGAEALEWAKTQAETTNAWAAEDRERYTSVFQPLQDDYIEEAQNWDSAERKDARASEAIADVRQQQKIADATRTRQAMAMGVNPNSGRFQSATAKASTDSALAAAGAGNMARRQVETEAEAKMANAINMGNGLAVNPGTSIGLSNGAMSTGVSAAQQGYSSQGSMLNAQYQNQLSAYNSSQSALGGLMSGLGMIGGAYLMSSSSKDFKENKRGVGVRPAGQKKGAAPGAESSDAAAMDAVRQMPVERWNYKSGIADEGEHIGPYAEDFQKATGIGDGKTIDVISQIGVSMGAIRDLDARMARLEGHGVRPKAARSIPAENAQRGGYGVRATEDRRAA